MNKIYKYEVQGVSYDPRVTLPVGSKIIEFEIQNDSLYLWAIIDTAQEDKEEKVFEIYGTGWDIVNPEQLTHLKTLHHSSFVWHIFIRNK